MLNSVPGGLALRPHRGRRVRMKTYTVVFREIRECEMQGIEAKSKNDAKCMAEQIIQSFGHENWVSKDMIITDCRLEKGADA